MAQLIFYNADNGKEGGRLSEVPSFLVHFRRCEEYDGGFGFDWMRDEYIYETKDLKQNIFDDKWDESTLPSICEKNEDLKKKYVELYEKQDKPYYIPWLSMFTHHETKIGEKVELQLKVEILDTKWNKAKVKFECPEGIRIVPEEVELTKKDTIEQDAKGKSENKYTNTKVTVFCDKEHAECQVIIKTVIDNKNPVETIVGKLCIIETKEYPLNIRIVKLLRQEHLDSDKIFLENRIGSITSYLKSKSLQQAMILPQIEAINKEIIISEEQWKKDGKLTAINDPENVGTKLYVLDHSKHIFTEYENKYELREEPQVCKEYEQYEEYKEVCREENYKDYKIIQRTNECGNGGKTVKIQERFKGIVIILSNINYKLGGVAGMGSFNPSQDNTCFITKLGLTDKSHSIDKPQKYYPSISHEIGHVLGLDHTFENTLINNNSFNNYNNAKEKLTLYLTELPQAEGNIIDQKEQRDNCLKTIEEYSKKGDLQNEEKYKKRIDIFSENIKKLSRNIITYKEFIPIHQEYVESYEWFRDNLDDNICYFFKQGTTDNIMDYYSLYSKHKIFNTFYHWQWVRMQKDLIKFHS